VSSRLRFTGSVDMIGVASTYWSPYGAPAAVSPDWLPAVIVVRRRFALDGLGGDMSQLRVGGATAKVRTATREQFSFRWYPVSP